MYKINSIDIELNVVNVNVTVIQKDGTELVCNVPVKAPKTKEDVILAIEQREAAEVLKYESAPGLEAIKAELEPSIGKVTTVAVK